MEVGMLVAAVAVGTLIAFLVLNRTD